MNPVPTISAVLIVKNEAEVLSKCLESVKDADEIIIVDTGSEDNTVEIAKKYTDKVYEDYKWNDNFAEARNHAKSKATKDWILSIDADEFCHDFSEVVEAAKIADRFGHLAVDCKLFAGDNGQMHAFPRFFKNDPRVFWNGAIHNHISVLGEPVGDIRITYGYSPAHLRDPNRAMRILEKEVATRPDAVREMFYLGREYFYKGRFEESVKLFGKYVQKSRFLSEKAEAFLAMSRAYYNMRMMDDARDACVQALIINPHFREAVLFMSVLAGDGSENPTWQKNADQWKMMASTADNSGVLFVRNV